MHNLTSPQGPFFLVVEDFIRAAIGPFPTHADALAHYNWSTTTRSDSSALIGIYPTNHPALDAPNIEHRITAEDDRDNTLWDIPAA